MQEQQPGHSEDTNQRVTYGYDTNAVNPGFSQYSQGRLATAQYTVGAPGTDTPVTEMYSRCRSVRPAARGWPESISSTQCRAIASGECV
jgi:hypothetical protein